LELVNIYLKSESDQKPDKKEDILTLTRV